MEKFDINDLCEFFLSKILIITIVTLVFMEASLGYSLFIKKPLYEAYTTIVLVGANSGDNSITQNDITLNQKLIATYREIIKSRKVLNQVIANLKLDDTVESLSEQIHVTNQTNTDLIKISLTYPNASNTASITNEIARVFMKEIVNLYNLQNVSVIDKAEVPQKASNMNTMKQAMIFGFLGLIFACSMLFLVYYFDTSIRNSEEIEEKLKLSLLGGIPFNKKYINSKELIVAHHPKSSIAEAFKTIRTNLQFSSIDEEIKNILVTSSVPNEGKSFVASNLALAFAQTGKKVLLVDCDMRRGRVHDIFQCHNDKGLSFLLLDNLDNTGQYIQNTSISNLFVLSRGIVPPNPSELLSSEKNKQLINYLSSKFDIIIYDGVPVLGLSDSVIMADLVDKIVLVSAYKYTRIEQLINTKKSLDKMNKKIAGVILNKLPDKKNKYYTYESE